MQNISAFFFLAARQRKVKEAKQTMFRGYAYFTGPLQEVILPKLKGVEKIFLDRGHKWEP